MMKKAIKLCAGAAAAILLSIIVVFVAFYHLIRIGEFQRFLAGEIERETGMNVRLGNGELEIGRILGVTFRDVELSQAGDAQPAITVERVTARVALAPLLRRRLIFYEIRFDRPAARFVRDRRGQVPLLAGLLNLPFFKRAGAQFTLDLRAVLVSRGELELLDHSGSEANLTTRFHNVALKLKRLRGQALRDFFQQLVTTRPKPPQGTALEFELITDVEKEGQAAKLSARGMMVSPREQLELGRAWWEADVRATDLPAAMARSYIGDRLAMRSLNGTLSSRLTFESDPERGMRVKGALAFHQLALDAPELFAAPIAPGDGDLQLDLTWRRNRWNLTRVELRSRELKVAIKGEVDLAESADPELRLTATSPSLSVAALKNYLPRKWLSSAQLEEVLAALREGELKINNAGISARLSEIGDIVNNRFDERLWFDAEFRDVNVEIAGGYLPVRRARGTLNLQRGLLSFKNLSGEYGQSRLVDLDGSYRLSVAGKKTLQLRAKGEADLAELREQMIAGVLISHGAAAVSSISAIDGRGRFDLSLTRAAESLPQLTGNMELDDASLRIDDIALSDIRGDVAISPAQIKAEQLRARLAGSPIQIHARLENYGDDGGTFDLTVESTRLRAAVLTRRLLSTGSLQDPGFVRGHIRYRGLLGRKEGRKLTGTLDLANVQLTTPPLLQPLRELNGRIKIDENGIDFENVKGLLVGVPAGFNGRWRYARKPHLLFDFTAPNLDVTYLISQIDPESSDFYANLEADGKIVLARGRIKAFAFSDFKSDVAIDRRVWRFKNPTLRSDGGSILGTATIADRPDTLGITSAPKVHGVPVQTFLKWFDMTSTEMTGRVNLAGNFDTAGNDGAERKRNLNGSFNLRIDDGTIRRLRILVQILNLLDLSRWFTLQMPDLDKEGIRFRGITGDFKVTKGVYATENLLVDSDDLRMTGAGKIDVPRDEIDFVVAVRPFPGIDTALNYIPLIGRGIAAVKNSFLVASFNITGSIDNPTITPAPLSTVSEWFLGVLGIPKSIIGFGGEEKKEKPGDRPLEPADGNLPGSAK